MIDDCSLESKNMVCAAASTRGDEQLSALKSSESKWWTWHKSKDMVSTTNREKHRLQIQHNDAQVKACKVFQNKESLGKTGICSRNIRALRAGKRKTSDQGKSTSRSSAHDKVIQERLFNWSTQTTQQCMCTSILQLSQCKTCRYFLFYFSLHVLYEI